jgi:asparagine synthase (glutamine-hydrolysing)
VRHAVEEWCACGGDTRQVWRWISLEVWLRVWGDEG